MGVSGDILCKEWAGTKSRRVAFLSLTLGLELEICLLGWIYWRKQQCSIFDYSPGQR
jgi:hypothetical protein